MWIMRVVGRTSYSPGRLGMMCHACYSSIHIGYSNILRIFLPRLFSPECR